MNKHELQAQVKELAVFKAPTARTPEGLSVSVPSWHFQGLNAGWWRYYSRRTDLPGESECAIIAGQLEVMDEETAKDHVRKLPSETVKQARGVDYDLGRHKVKYEKGGSDESTKGS